LDGLACREIEFGFLTRTTEMAKVFNEKETADLLPFEMLVANLRATVVEYAAGLVHSPERLVVPLRDGGVMLSMPATADDIAIHKLVNVCPRNSGRGLPTIHGQVMACDASTGAPLFVLDGPTVTGRRTAGITALGIMTLSGSTPKGILLIGTGRQAAFHAEAFSALFPSTPLFVTGRSQEDARRFAKAQASAMNITAVADVREAGEADVVVTLTTSKTPVYCLPADSARLVVGVGAFTPDAAEIAPEVVQSSQVVVDDPAGAKHEAGDLIQAKVDWSRVKSLADMITHTPPVADAPLLFKSVGCAAWDLSACRVAREQLAL
jgi:1-piperideine-2-carboxylate/1-pyrroline-2-carboxylate reductase [NAD(P)H]